MAERWNEQTAKSFADLADTAKLLAAEGTIDFNFTKAQLVAYLDTLYTAVAGVLLAANNLSDLDNLLTAQQNLELEKGVDVQTYNAFRAGITDAASGRTALDAQQQDALLNDLAGQSVIDGSLLLGDGADSFENIAVASAIETLLKAASLDAGGVIAKTGAQAKTGVLTLSDGIILGGGADVLEDYEEGSWTPTVDFDTTGDFVPTYAVQSGSYIKLGNIIFFTVRVQFDTNAYTTASGKFLIGGLPFTVNNSLPTIQPAANAHFQNFAFNVDRVPVLSAVRNATDLSVRTSRASDTVFDWNTGVVPASTTGFNVSGSGFYLAG